MRRSPYSWLTRVLVTLTNGRRNGVVPPNSKMVACLGHSSVRREVSECAVSTVCRLSGNNETKINKRERVGTADRSGALALARL